MRWVYHVLFVCMLRDAIGTMTTEIHIVLPTMRSTENSYDYVIAYHTGKW